MTYLLSASTDTLGIQVPITSEPQRRCFFIEHSYKFFVDVDGITYLLADVRLSEYYPFLRTMDKGTYYFEEVIMIATQS